MTDPDARAGVSPRPCSRPRREGRGRRRDRAASARRVAKRLVDAGDEVVIGSRDADAGARGGRAARRRGRDERGRRPRRRPRRARRQGRRGARDGPRAAAGDRRDAGPLGRDRALVRPGRREADRRGRPRSRERIQDELDAPVVAGLHSLAAVEPRRSAPPDEDALVCGDDADAKELALELAGRLVSGRALDAGPLASARALEGMTAVIVNLNKRYKAHAGLRVTGLP